MTATFRRPISNNQRDGKLLAKRHRPSRLRFDDIFLRELRSAEILRINRRPSLDRRQGEDTGLLVLGAF